MIKHFFIISFLFVIVLLGHVYAQGPAPLIVHFPFDSYRLSAAARDALDSFFHAVVPAGGTALVTRSRNAFIRPGDTVLVSGYTDSVGTSGYNEALSMRRAFAVRAYLVAKGWLAAGRIKTAGYGERYPLAGNGSDSERAANRRVEILLRSASADTVAVGLAMQRDSIRAVIPDTTPAQKETVVVPGGKETAVVPAEAPKRTIYDAVMDSSIAVGGTIPLRDVNFFPGRHFPLPVCNLILDELARAMKANQRLRIRIEGHICCLPDGIDGGDLGTGQPNLSVQRAKYVYDYLVMRGIAKKRMSYVGYGASGKLYPREENEVERAENRRVEIRIMAR